MNLHKQQINRIKNLQAEKKGKDFNYNAFSYLILGLFLIGGIICQLLVKEDIEPNYLVYTAVAVIIGAGILTAFPLWSLVIQLEVLAWLGMYAGLGGNFYPLYGFIFLGFLLSPAFQLVYQWDKVVILRAGKFKKVHGPGIFMLLPVFDRIAEFVDTRIRATDFSAEKSLTKDTVPVHVDALAFWMIWDAQKAVLEVENYIEAVTLSAQTALRDSIGKHDLTTLLSERETLCNEIQSILDAKTNPWGITIQSVEFTEIIIPIALEDAMSKKAQAEREKQSRVILGAAEVEIAEKFEKAAEKYRNNPTALQLRAMNMVYEGIRQKGSMMLLPSSALDSMNLGAVMGTIALNKTDKKLSDIDGEDDEKEIGDGDRRE